MNKKLFLTLLIFVLAVSLSCNWITQKLSLPDGGSAGPSSSDSPDSGLTGGAPQPITPEFFSQVQVSHEYWPAIRKAAVLPDTAKLVLFLTDYDISDDGRYLAVAGCDLEWESGELMYGEFPPLCTETMEGAPRSSHAFFFILDARTEEVVAKLPETEEALTISRVGFTHDGNKLIYSVDYGTSRPGEVKIWDIASGEIQTVIPVDWNTDPLWRGAVDFVLSPDGNLISMVAGPPTRIWDVKQGKFVAELPELAIWPFSESGDKMMILGWPEETVSIYDTATWQRIHQFSLPTNGPYAYFAAPPDLSGWVRCDRTLDSTEVKIWDLENGELIKTLESDLMKCNKLFFTPDKRLLLLFDDHGAGPLIWEVDGWVLHDENAATNRYIQPGERFVIRLNFTQDGRNMLVETDQRLTLYSLP